MFQLPLDWQYAFSVIRNDYSPSARIFDAVEYGPNGRNDDFGLVYQVRRDDQHCRGVPFALDRTAVGRRARADTEDFGNSDEPGERYRSGRDDHSGATPTKQRYEAAHHQRAGGDQSRLQEIIGES